MSDLEQKAIERIKIASEMSLSYYQKPLVCTYSGGKDSDVMLELFKRSGVPFEVHNSHTTVDAPRLYCTSEMCSGNWNCRESNATLIITNNRTVRELLCGT